MSSPAPDVAYPATPPDLEAFVARHWAFAQRLIAAKVRWVRDADRDDTRSDGLLALWEAARTFDPAKGGKEEAHVLHTISWRLIDHHRDRYGRAGRPGHHGPPLPLDDGLTRVLVDPHDDHAGRTDAVAVHQVLAALEPQHRDVLTAYFIAGRALADIGREQGVSESRISKKVKAALSVARQVSEGQSPTTSRRPATIACQTCGVPVPVKPTGRMPRYCTPCRARRTKHAPRPALVAGRGAFVRSRPSWPAWTTSTGSSWSARPASTRHCRSTSRPSTTSMRCRSWLSGGSVARCSPSSTTRGATPSARSGRYGHD